MTADPAPSERSRIRRDDRARYDRASIDAVLDEAVFCHVGVIDEGRPVVIPMLHARVDDHLLLHGSPATRLFRLLKTRPEICVTATVIDGLVLARSAFHHSTNYRSVVLFGRPEPVTDLEERARALDALTDRLVPGRRPHLRPMTEKEIRGTAMVRLPISEASSKYREGPPIDDEEDRNWPVWAGVLPMMTTFGTPVPDEDTPSGADLPDHISAMISSG
jgi:nitroimidazol reductase NimA-like FMN-containing flavoprotein (pyridoxamine 5'-phosphate oxidase superfamily)